MPAPEYLDPRLTEHRNPRTERIDVASPLEIVDLINSEDATVAAAVHREREAVARAIELTVAAFQAGGRLVYVGAGAAGGLGGLDASECPPTFGAPPEVLTGSTRMKAATATKLVLNTVTTGAMIRMGRAYGNLMVDLMARSDKLRDRGERIVMECCEVDRGAARRAIEAAGGSAKLAIVMVRKGIAKAEGERLLEQAGGSVRRAVGDPPPVTEARGRR